MKKVVEKIFEDFSKTKVLLIGDGMIDAYIWGDIHRESPEAPVPVVDVYKREKRLGGAGNVAKNLTALGAETVFCGFIGEDDNGAIFRSLMADNGLDDKGLYVVNGRPTSVKTRVIVKGNHVIRVDEEDTNDLKDYTSFKKLIHQLFETNNFDIVIFQDYNKGVLGTEVIKYVIDLARESDIPTVVDPKKNNFLSYKNVSLFKPNLKEIKEGLNIEFNDGEMEDVASSTKILRTKLNADRILLTMSEKGMYIQNNKGEHHIPAFERNVMDVSGAGDTVLSVAALALANNLSDHQIAVIANLAGGLVCEEVGVVPIDKEKLMKEAIKYI